jgi:hypothetical protein
MPHDVWWLGFDCAHAWDLVPSMIAFEIAAGFEVDRHDVYRDLAYVQRETEALAEQLRALAAMAGA